MDKISVEEFKRNIKACLDKLPFEVTRRGKVLFVCYGPEGKKPPSITMPVPKIVDSSPSDSVVIPAKLANKPAIKPVPVPTPETQVVLPNGYIVPSALELHTKYKISHPMDICNRCRQFNRSCVCGATIYEPDDIQPARKRKQASNAAPVVQAMLSKIKRDPIVQHHPGCTCAVCKSE